MSTVTKVDNARHGEAKINKERIKSDNWPLLMSFENDSIHTSQVLKIKIIQTAAQQKYMSVDRYRKNSIKRPYSNKRPSPYLDAPNGHFICEFCNSRNL